MQCQSITPNNIIRVSEVYEAAVLRAEGLALRGYEIDSGRERIVLLFNDPKGDANALITAHHSGHLKISTAKYGSAISWVKDQFFSARRASGLDKPRRQ